MNGTPLSLEKNKNRIFCVYFTVKGQLFFEQSSHYLKTQPPITHVCIRGTKESDSALALDGSHIVIEVFVESINIDTAINIAKAFIYPLVTCKSFLAAVPSEQPKFVIAYDATNESEEREHVQVFYTVFGPARKIDFIQLLRITEGILRSDDRERIVRSMHWMRNAISASDVLDMLAYAYIAFETINPLLVEKYSISGSVKTKLNCPHCSKEFEKDAPGLNGVNHFFKTTTHPQFSFDTWKEAKSIRVAIIHSLLPLGGLRLRSWQVTFPFIQALYEAIRSLLADKVPDRDFTDVASYTRSGELVECHQIKGWLVNIDPTDPATYPIVHPHFTMPNLNIEIKFNNDGSSDSTFETKSSRIGDFEFRRYATGMGGAHKVEISDSDKKSEE